MKILLYTKIEAVARGIGGWFVMFHSGVWRFWIKAKYTWWVCDQCLSSRYWLLYKKLAVFSNFW